MVRQVVYRAQKRKLLGRISIGLLVGKSEFVLCCDFIWCKYISSRMVNSFSLGHFNADLRALSQCSSFLMAYPTFRKPLKWDAICQFGVPVCLQVKL
jgi:hypothetical protein